MQFHPRLRSTVVLAVVSLALVPAVAGAQAKPDSGALIRALEDCRRIAEAPARLACFDGAAARFVEAERAGDVVVVDREQAQAARRQAFGFSLPSLNIFDRMGDQGAADRVSLVILGASQDASGKWVLTTEEGQVWRQIAAPGPRRAPKRGARAEVRRTGLGGYFMNIDGQRAIRVRREQ